MLPSALHRLVSGALLKATRGKSWLDDILVPSTTFARHLKTLRVVLEYLLTAGLTVNFQKSNWCAPKDQLLGMVIGEAGVRPSAFKVEAII